MQTCRGLDACWIEWELKREGEWIKLGTGCTNYYLEERRVKREREIGGDRRMLRVDHSCLCVFFFFFLSQRRLARCGGQRWIRAWMSWTARVPHPTRGAQVSVVGSETSLQGDHQLSRSGLVSMLTQPDALPGTQRQTAVADRQGQRRSQEASFDVGGLMSSNIRIVIIIITCWLFGAIVIRRADGRRQKIRWQSAGIPVEEISARVSGERGGVMEFLTIVKVKEDSKIKK